MHGTGALPQPTRGYQNFSQVTPPPPFCRYLWQTSHRKVLRERTKALVSCIVSATADGQNKVKEWESGCYQKKLLELSPEGSRLCSLRPVTSGSPTVRTLGEILHHCEASHPVARLVELSRKYPAFSAPTANEDSKLRTMHAGLG